MINDSIFGPLTVVGLVLSWSQYVTFGFLTVRRLRKIPELDYDLGTRFIGGRDVFKVAAALAVPKPWINKVENSSISFYISNPTLIRKNTNKFEQAFGASVFWSFWIAFLYLASIVILIELGF
ncbi:hypothetical protein [Microbulbifer aggregans]|uniref:hypothetical protein n=1 Tax=Microbulbifer aggregans TaxID=1769779 RepID=UPI001CFCDC2A|nr:hypothetical protein [Microbulbifer aggregans]